jgi:hypothetical protein
MARRRVRSGASGRLDQAGTSSGLSSVQWSSEVRREDQRLGRGLRVEGRVRLARLVLARISLAMSRDQAARRSGEWPVTRRGTHGPKESEAGASSPGRNILGIEQRTVVLMLVSRRTSDSDEVSESKGE